MPKETKSGASGGRRKSVFVRLDETTHRKLMRLVAARYQRNTSGASKQAVIVDLIQQTPEPR